MISSQRLLSVINDILDFSQINLGKFSLNISKFSINKLLKEVAQIFEPEVIKKGLEFIIENLSDLQDLDIISNDEGRLKQVLCNLLSNSLRFTTNGFVKMAYECIKNESGLKIRFKVEDSGCGIKESMITKLFEFFGKIRECDYKSLNTDGIGFGLAISQKLIMIMNQNENDIPIKVTSIVGQGSIFSFEIMSNRIPQNTCFNQDSNDFMGKINELMEEDNPIENITNYNLYTKNNRLDSNTSFLPKNKINKKILIVDDDSINIIVMSRYLKSQPNIEFMTASNGLEALNILQNEAGSLSYFDLVLMDCNMPVMDGYEASEKIRDLIDNNIIPDTPIIAVTANVLLSDLERCLECGMVDYLTKPLNKTQLLEKINKYLV